MPLQSETLNETIPEANGDRAQVIAGVSIAAVCLVVVIYCAETLRGRKCGGTSVASRFRSNWQERVNQIFDSMRRVKSHGFKAHLCNPMKMAPPNFITMQRPLGIQGKCECTWITTRNSDVDMPGKISHEGQFSRIGKLRRGKRRSTKSGSQSAAVWEERAPENHLSWNDCNAQRWSREVDRHSPRGRRDFSRQSSSVRGIKRAWILDCISIFSVSSCTAQFDLWKHPARLAQEVMKKSIGRGVRGLKNRTWRFRRSAPGGGFVSHESIDAYSLYYLKITM